MKVILAGYNVEAEQLHQQIPQSNLTPEVFSAAYAKISRSPKSIEKLRRIARTDIHKARESNKTIIFKMGHHSVAEHAVFNFDIIGVSRLALEELERFRLVSFTEKSQRYVTLKGDYFIPGSFGNNPPIKQNYINIIELQNNFYKKACIILKDDIFNKYPNLAEKKANKSLLDGWAKEDARYILSLATLGQVGITINARNLEYLFRKCHLSELTEVQDLGKIMHDKVMKISPSIILFAKPSDYEKNTYNKLLFNSEGLNRPPVSDLEFKVIDYTKNGDDKILGAMLFLHNTCSYSKALKYIESMRKSEKIKIFKKLFSNMEFFDRPSREFELAHITFQASVSASSFAQIKRHRMATLINNQYDIKYKNTIPRSIKENKLENEFLDIINQTNQTYLDLQNKHGQIADYILTNSHRKQIIMKVNLREVYHFSRLREDEHAQWDIKELAIRISKTVKKLFPLSTMMLGGKSDYNKLFKSIYNKNPKFKI